VIGEVAGVEFRYKHGHKLVGDRTAKSLILSLSHSLQMMLLYMPLQKTIDLLWVWQVVGALLVKPIRK